MNIDNVRAILENSHLFEWSLQGFGMLRAYLTRTVRLHLWDSEFMVPNVSTIHDHPWNFTSVVLAGRMVNQIYRRKLHYGRTGDPKPATHRTMEIQCGEGGCALGDANDMVLLPRPSRLYKPGARYDQLKHEIHESLPTDGTLTLVVRDFDGDPDRANVFWPIGEEWVSAEPRPATREEIDAACARSLSRWF